MGNGNGDSTGKASDSSNKDDTKVTKPVTPQTPVTHPREQVFGDGTLRDAVKKTEPAKSDEIPPLADFDPFADAKVPQKKSAGDAATLAFVAFMGGVDDQGRDDGKTEGNGDAKGEKPKEGSGERKSEGQGDKRDSSAPAARGEIKSGDQVHVDGPDYGFIAGRTPDGKVIVQLAGQEDNSTADEAKHDSAWFEAHGYKAVQVDVRDERGNVTGRSTLYYHAGDPGNVLDEPELVSTEDNLERRPSNFRILGKDELKPVKVERENIDFQTRNGPIQCPDVDVQYRLFPDGVRIGVPIDRGDPRGLSPQRDVRIYSPDEGATKIPLFRENAWFHFAAHRGSREGDVKFHIFSTSPEDASALDKIALPLLHEALSDNPKTPEARALHDLIVSAKMQDPLNRDADYSDPSVDRAQKLFTKGRPVGPGTAEARYAELHTGPRGQESKHYTVYARNVEDARKAAKIVDEYIAARAKENPSLVLPADTTTGSASDGRRLPGSNRIALARETWELAHIPNSTYQDAAYFDEMVKVHGAEKGPREAIGASVEREIGDKIRQYAKNKYGKDGPLNQADLDQICKDAGIKEGFLAFDNKGKLAVHGDLWVTGRGSDGDLAYLGDGDAEKMKAPKKTEGGTPEKSGGLTGRHAMYALYELVNGKDSPDRDPLHHVERSEARAKQNFLENRPGWMRSDEDFQLLKDLRKSMYEGDVTGLQKALKATGDLNDRRRSDAILNQFSKELEAHGLEAKITRPPLDANSIQLEVSHQGFRQLSLSISSEASKPSAVLTRDWSDPRSATPKVESNTNPEAVQKWLRSHSESLQYRVKYDAQKQTAESPQPRKLHSLKIDDTRGDAGTKQAPGDKGADDRALAEKFARDFPGVASAKFQDDLGREIRAATRDWPSLKSDLELFQRLSKMSSQSRQAEENMLMVPEGKEISEAAKANADKFEKMNEPVNRKLVEELKRRTAVIEETFNKVLKANGQPPVQVVAAMHNKGDRPEIKQGGAYIPGTKVIEVDADLILSGRSPEVIAEGLTHEYVHALQNRHAVIDIIDDVESGKSKYGKGENAVRLEFRERTGVDTKIADGQTFDLSRKSMEARVFNALPEETRVRLLGSADLLPADSLVEAGKLKGKSLTAGEFNALKPEERKLLTGNRLWSDLQEDCQKEYGDMKGRAGTGPVLSDEFKARGREITSAMAEYGVHNARADALAQRVNTLRQARDLLNNEGGVETLLKRLTTADDKTDPYSDKAAGSKLKEQIFGDKEIPQELSRLIDDFKRANKEGRLDHKIWTTEKSTRANQLLRGPINEGNERAPVDLKKEMESYYQNRLEREAYTSARFLPPERGSMVDFRWGNETRRGQLVHSGADGTTVVLEPEGSGGDFRAKTAQDRELKDIKLPPSIERFVERMGGTGKLFTDGKGKVLIEVPGDHLIEFGPLKVVARDQVSSAKSQFPTGGEVYDRLVKENKIDNPLLKTVETGDFSDFAQQSLKRMDLAMETSWAVPHRESLAAIYNFAGQQGVVEAGAGKGYWAHMLRQMGVDVVAYDLNPLDEGANEYHSGKSWSTVLKGDASVAARHPDRALLLCCPPPDNPMAADALKAYGDAGGKKLIFVGKIPLEGTDDPVIFGDQKFHETLKKDWVLKEAVDLPGMPFGSGVSSEKLYVFEKRGTTGDAGPRARTLSQVNVENDPLSRAIPESSFKGAHEQLDRVRKAALDLEQTIDGKRVPSEKDPAALNAFKKNAEELTRLDKRFVNLAALKPGETIDSRTLEALSSLNLPSKQFDNLRELDKQSGNKLLSDYQRRLLGDAQALSEILGSNPDLNDPALQDALQKWINKEENNPNRFEFKLKFARPDNVHASGEVSVGRQEITLDTSLKKPSDIIGPLLHEREHIHQAMQIVDALFERDKDALRPLDRETQIDRVCKAYVKEAGEQIKPDFVKKVIDSHDKRYKPEMPTAEKQQLVKDGLKMAASHLASYDWERENTILKDIIDTINRTDPKTIESISQADQLKVLGPDAPDLIRRFREETRGLPDADAKFYQKVEEAMDARTDSCVEMRRDLVASYLSQGHERLPWQITMDVEALFSDAVKPVKQAGEGLKEPPEGDRSAGDTPRNKDGSIAKSEVNRRVAEYLADERAAMERGDWHQKLVDWQEYYKRQPEAWQKEHDPNIPDNWRKGRELAAKELQAVAERAARKNGLTTRAPSKDDPTPPTVVSDETLSFTRMNDREVGGDYGTMRIRLDIMNNDPANTVEHEVLHYREHLDRTAIRVAMDRMARRGKVEPGTFDRMVAEECAKYIGEPGLRRERSGLQQRHAYENPKAIEDMRSLFKDYIKTNPKDGAASRLDLADWLKTRGIPDSLLKEFGSERNVVLELSGEVDNFLKVKAAVTIPDTYIAGRPDVFLSPDERKAQPEMDKPAQPSSFDRDMDYIRRMADHFEEKGSAAEAAKLLHGIAPASVGRQDKSYYRLSIEEIRARRFQFSQELKRALQSGDARESRTMREQILIGNSQERLMRSLDKAFDLDGNSSLTDVEKSRLRSQHIDDAKKEARLLVLGDKTSEPPQKPFLQGTADDRRAVKFMVSMGLLTQEELKNTPFANLEFESEVEAIKAARAERRAHLWEAKADAALVTVKAIKEGKPIADLIGESKVLPTGETEYKLKEPIKIQIRPGVSAEVESIYAKNNLYSFKIKTPIGEPSVTPSEMDGLVKGLQSRLVSEQSDPKAGQALRALASNPRDMARTFADYLHNISQLEPTDRPVKPGTASQKTYKFGVGEQSVELFAGQEPRVIGSKEADLSHGRLQVKVGMERDGRIYLQNNGKAVQVKIDGKEVSPWAESDRNSKFYLDPASKIEIDGVPIGLRESSAKKVEAGNDVLIRDGQKYLPPDSRTYETYGYLSPEQKFLPGFKLRETIYDQSQGKRVARLSTTVIDPVNDPVLKSVITDCVARYGEIIDPRERMEKIVQHVNNLLSPAELKAPPDWKPRNPGDKFTISDALQYIDRTYGGKEIMAGKYISLGLGGDAQKAVIIKAVAEGMGLDVGIESGNLSGNKPHTWNTLKTSDGEILHYDADRRQFHGVSKEQLPADYHMKPRQVSSLRQQFFKDKTGTGGSGSGTAGSGIEGAGKDGTGDTSSLKSGARVDPALSLGVADKAEVAKFAADFGSLITADPELISKLDLSKCRDRASLDQAIRAFVADRALEVAEQKGNDDPAAKKLFALDAALNVQGGPKDATKQAKVDHLIDRILAQPMVREKVIAQGLAEQAYLVDPKVSIMLDQAERAGSISKAERQAIANVSAANLLSPDTIKSMLQSEPFKNDAYRQDLMFLLEESVGWSQNHPEFNKRTVEALAKLEPADLHAALSCPDKSFIEFAKIYEALPDLKSGSIITLLRQGAPELAKKHGQMTPELKELISKTDGAAQQRLLEFSADQWKGLSQAAKNGIVTDKTIEKLLSCQNCNALLSDILVNQSDSANQKLALETLSANTLDMISDRRSGSSDLSWSTIGAICNLPDAERSKVISLMSLKDGTNQLVSNRALSDLIERKPDKTYLTALEEFCKEGIARNTATTQFLNQGVVDALVRKEGVNAGAIDRLTEMGRAGLLNESAMKNLLKLPAESITAVSDFSKEPAVKSLLNPDLLDSIVKSYESNPKEIKSELDTVKQAILDKRLDKNSLKEIYGQVPKTREDLILILPELDAAGTKRLLELKNAYAEAFDNWTSRRGPKPAATFEEAIAAISDGITSTEPTDSPDYVDKAKLKEMSSDVSRLREFVETHLIPSMKRRAAIDEIEKAKPGELEAVPADRFKALAERLNNAIDRKLIEPKKALELTKKLIKAGESVGHVPIDGIARFAYVDDRIIRGGRPGGLQGDGAERRKSAENAIRELAARGVKTYIDLEPAGHDRTTGGPDVAAICRANGIEYVHVPQPADGKIEDRQAAIKKAADLVEERRASGGVFLASADGKEGASLVVAEYRGRNSPGISISQIAAEMRKFGVEPTAELLMSVPNLEIENKATADRVINNAKSIVFDESLVRLSEPVDKVDFFRSANSLIANYEKLVRAQGGDPAKDAASLRLKQASRLDSGQLSKLTVDEMKSLTDSIGIAGRERLDALRRDARIGHETRYATFIDALKSAKFDDIRSGAIIDLARAMDQEYVKSLSPEQRRDFTKELARALDPAKVKDASKLKLGIKAAESLLPALTERSRDGGLDRESLELSGSLLAIADNPDFGAERQSILKFVGRNIAGEKQADNVDKAVERNLLDAKRILDLGHRPGVCDAILNTVPKISKEGFDALIDLADASFDRGRGPQGLPSTQEAFQKNAAKLSEAIVAGKITPEDLRQLKVGIESMKTLKESTSPGNSVGQDIMSELIARNPKGPAQVLDVMKECMGRLAKEKPGDSVKNIQALLNRGDACASLFAQFLEQGTLASGGRDHPLADTLAQAKLPDGPVNPDYLKACFNDFKFASEEKADVAFRNLSELAKRQSQVLKEGSPEAARLLNDWRDLISQYHPKPPKSSGQGVSTRALAITRTDLNKPVFDYLAELTRHNLINEDSLNLTKTDRRGERTEILGDIIDHTLSKDRLSQLPAEMQARMLLGIRDVLEKEPHSNDKLKLSLMERFSEDALRHLGETDLKWYTEKQREQMTKRLKDAGFKQPEIDVFLENIRRTANHARGEVVSDKLAGTLLSGLTPEGRQKVIEYLKQHSDVLSDQSFRRLIQDEGRELLEGGHKRYVHADTGQPGKMRPAINGLVLGPASPGNQLAIRLHKTTQMHINFNRVEVDPQNRLVIVAPDGGRSLVEKGEDGSLMARKLRYSDRAKEWVATDERTPLDRFVLLDNPKDVQQQRVRDMLLEMQKGDRLYVPDKLVGSLEATKEAPQRVEGGAFGSVSYQKIAAAEANDEAAKELARALDAKLGLERRDENGKASTEEVRALKEAATSPEHARTEAKLLQYYANLRPGTEGGEGRRPQPMTEQARWKLVMERAAVDSNFVKHWQLSDLYAESPKLQANINKAVAEKTRSKVETKDMIFAVLPREGSGYEFHQIHLNANSKDIRASQFEQFEDLKRRAKAGELGGKVITYIDDAFDDGEDGRRKIENLREIRDLAQKSGHPVKDVVVATWFRFEADKNVPGKYKDITWVNAIDCESLPTRIANKHYVDGATGEGLPEKLQGDYTKPNWVPDDKPVKDKPGADVYPHIAGNDLEQGAFDQARAGGLPGARALGLSYDMYVPLVHALPDYYKEINKLTNPTDAQKGEALRRSLQATLEKGSELSKWSGEHRRAVEDYLRDLDRFLANLDDKNSQEGLRDILQSVESVHGSTDVHRRQALAELKREELSAPPEAAAEGIKPKTKMTMSKGGPVSFESYEFGEGIKLKTAEFGEITVKAVRKSEGQFWLECTDSKGQPMERLDADRVSKLLLHEISESYMKSALDNKGKQAEVVAAYLEKVGEAQANDGTGSARVDRPSPFNETQRKVLDEVKKILNREAPGLNIRAQNDAALRGILQECVNKIADTTLKSQLSDLLKDFKGDELRSYLSGDTNSGGGAGTADVRPTTGLAQGDEGHSTKEEDLRKRLVNATPFDEVKALELRRSGKILETLKADGMDEKRAKELEEKLTSKDANERAKALEEIDKFYDALIAKSEAEANPTPGREGEKEKPGEKARRGRGWDHFAKKFGENKGKIGTLIVVLGPLLPIVLNKRAESEGEFGGASFSK